MKGFVARAAMYKMCGPSAILVAACGSRYKVVTQKLTTVASFQGARKPNYPYMYCLVAESGIGQRQPLKRNWFGGEASVLS